MNAVRFIIIHMIASAMLLDKSAFSQTVNEDQIITAALPAQDDAALLTDAAWDHYVLPLLERIDLNDSDADRLRSLHLLTEAQISALMDFRLATGAIQSLYELQVINGFDEDLIRRLMPILKVAEITVKPWKGLIHRMADASEAYYLLGWSGVMEPQAGYRSRDGIHAAYGGPPIRRYGRIRLSEPGDFAAGLSFESDAGERFTWKPSRYSYGADFVSGFIRVREKGKMENMIIGNYRAAFGQGLITGGGFSVGKGAETVTAIRKASTGFMPYTSNMESGYFSGASFTYRLIPDLRVHAYISRVRRDGQTMLAADSLEFISSVSSSGFHRTSGEWARRKTWRESVAGFAATVKKGPVEAGIQYQGISFSAAFRKGTAVYQIHDFQGTSQHMVGGYLNFQAGPLAFFSEAAWSEYARSLGLVAGFLAVPAPMLDVSVLARRYDPGFQSFFGGAFSENTQARNEEGVYIGWKFKPNRRHVFTGYIDHFRFPAPRFRCYQPSAGEEWLLRYAWAPDKKTTASVQMRVEEKYRNIPDPLLKDFAVAPVRRRQLVLQLDHKISDRWSGALRYQTSGFEHWMKEARGYALFGELSLTAKRWKGNARYAVFHAPDSEVSIYAYEPDVWSAYSFPALSGQGTRLVFNSRYSVSRRMDVWFKYSLTHQPDRDGLGYGLDYTKGPVRQEWRIQVRCRL